MLELKGKYCKDCKIFTDNIDQDALSMIYHFLDHPMFEGSKIRIMPDGRVERLPHRRRHEGIHHRHGGVAGVR